MCAIFKKLHTVWKLKRWVETCISRTGMTLNKIVGVFLFNFEDPCSLNCKKPVSAFGGISGNYFDVVPPNKKFSNVALPRGTANAQICVLPPPHL
jgi:hypothetical protein